MDHHILLPSKPRVVKEDENKGVYEIDGLYPGYGHTLGNSLRRIILSSLPGAAVTTIKITGVPHEFSTITGIKEDVITIILNLKKVRFKMTTDEPQKATLSKKGLGVVLAKDLKTPGQLEVLNGDLPIAELTNKNAHLEMEVMVERGLGFVPKEILQKSKIEVGTITTDAIYSPIRRVSYEVENMRVGDKTNHNRLRIFIETDGTLSPREALSKSIRIMLDQLKAILDITEPEEEVEEVQEKVLEKEPLTEDYADILKTRIDAMDFSTRTLNALTAANIRTIGGLARKKEAELLEIEGMGTKGLTEIKKVLLGLGISLKE